MFFLDAFLKGLHKQGDDDAIDRLNYYWTPMLLVIFALTLSAKQYVGQPIQCWIPAQFTGAWEQYSENYCFVQNTYFISPDKYIPDNEIDREGAEIGYYQWVPFILGLQAILFYLPSLFWRLMNFNSGVALKKMLYGAKKADRVDEKARHEAAKATGAHLYESLTLQSRFAKYTSSFTYGGSYLSLLYLFVKFLYLIQIIFQFIILNNFLGTSYTFWGIGILSDILNGREWEESGHFPRVTMCDFEVRVLGNKHRHTVQCVLMINMFNEKVYVFLWFWLVIVGIATFLNLINWTRKLLFRGARKAHIKAYLQVENNVSDDDSRSSQVLDKFVDYKLKSDGVFITHLIDNNGGSVFSHDVIVDMWDRFLQEEESRSQKKPAEFREI
ncbi:hypothetical protein CAEBREN_31716 [Caenorhabditis brenneri]|uniref:Innexin n=2 Tax=Caenorhabditis brenneri TaxID=135651 RepID=G0NJH2_CAEBE|nr:hypothetical protein CAEBREN_31716 [Caenorhabditis brenneri]